MRLTEGETQQERQTFQPLRKRDTARETDLPAVASSREGLGSLSGGGNGGGGRGGGRCSGSLLRRRNRV